MCCAGGNKQRQTGNQEDTHERSLRGAARPYKIGNGSKRTDQNGSGITDPVSPGCRFTETTVALGKKLNSEALAQV